MTIDDELSNANKANTRLSTTSNSSSQAEQDAQAKARAKGCCQQHDRVPAYIDDEELLEVTKEEQVHPDDYPSKKKMATDKADQAAKAKGSAGHGVASKVGAITMSGAPEDEEATNKKTGAPRAEARGAARIQVVRSAAADEDVEARSASGADADAKARSAFADEESKARARKAMVPSRMRRENMDTKASGGVGGENKSLTSKEQQEAPEEGAAAAEETRTEETNAKKNQDEENKLAPGTVAPGMQAVVGLMAKEEKPEVDDYDYDEEEGVYDAVSAPVVAELAPTTDTVAELLRIGITKQLSKEVANQLQAERQNQVIVEAVQVENRESICGITRSKTCWIICIGILLLIVIVVVGAAVAVSSGRGGNGNDSSEVHSIVGDGFDSDDTILTNVPVQAPVLEVVMTEPSFPGSTPAPTFLPTPVPTLSPPVPTNSPSPALTGFPTQAPFPGITPSPASPPTPPQPTPNPTRAPSLLPTKAPTPQPTRAPTPAPTRMHTPSPTSQPTVAATRLQILVDRIGPTLVPDDDTSLWTNPDTPEFEALNWLANIDSANLPIGATVKRILVERYTLALLYFSTGGSSWVNQYNFLSADTVCDWNDGEFDGENGVFCIGAFANAISMPGNNIQGPFPPGIGLLDRIQYLNFEFNAFTGTLPREFFSLTDLEGFGFVGNAISGTIPSEIGNLSFLAEFDLSENILTGTLPSDIGRLVDLQYVFLGSNRLQGELPSELGFLTNLVELYLYENRFTGKVPVSFSNLINLNELGLETNRFTGGLDTLFCDRDEELYIFTADCTTECDCCTDCYE